MNSLHLLDLPIEVLCLILEKLDSIDAFHSVIKVNHPRLDQAVQTYYRTNTLDFLSMSTAMFDRFCPMILPAVGGSVRSLVVQATLLKRVLLAAECPQLRKLRIYDCSRAMLSPERPECLPWHLCPKQITDLTLTVEDDIVTTIFEDCLVSDYAVLLGLFENLQRLTIIPALINGDCWFRLAPSSPASFTSSTLTSLSVQLISFTECLTLLDGRLTQLTAFIVQIHQIDYDIKVIRPRRSDPIPLTSFSLTSFQPTQRYAKEILPLIRRMVDLRDLTLYLHPIHQSTLIDGDQLNQDIANHLPRLRSFTFYLATKHIGIDTAVHPSNEDIQRTFVHHVYPPVVAINEEFDGHSTTHRIFSLPFAFSHLCDISSHFPELHFGTVTHLSIKDKRGFQHEFFVRLARCFPILRHLCIRNVKGTLCSDHLFHYDAFDRTSVVRFDQLISLDLERACMCYTERFLNDADTQLPRLAQLTMWGLILRIVTADFTRDATRKNCANVKRLLVDGLESYTPDLLRYFPSLIQ